VCVCVDLHLNNVMLLFCLYGNYQLYMRISLMVHVGCLTLELTNMSISSNFSYDKVIIVLLYK
jgi:hypothetical protein